MLPRASGNIESIDHRWMRRASSRGLAESVRPHRNHRASLTAQRIFTTPGQSVRQHWNPRVSFIAQSAEDLHEGVAESVRQHRIHRPFLDAQRIFTRPVAASARQHRNRRRPSHSLRRIFPSNLLLRASGKIETIDQAECAEDLYEGCCRERPATSNPSTIVGCAQHPHEAWPRASSNIGTIEHR